MIELSFIFDVEVNKKRDIVIYKLKNYYQL